MSSRTSTAWFSGWSLAESLLLLPVLSATKPSPPLHLNFLLAANALNQTYVQLFKIVGLALFGLPRGEAERQPANYLAELRERFAFVFRNQALRLLMVPLGLAMFLVFMYDSMVPLAVDGLGLSGSYVGYLVAAVGAGGIIGATLVAQLATQGARSC